MLSKHDYRLAAKSLRQQAFDAHPSAGQSLVESVYPLINQASVVGGYYPMGHEISPLPIMEVLQGKGINLALPLEAEKGQPLLFRAWGFEDFLYKNARGFYQPDAQAPLVKPDTLLVPLLAFDKNNFRLGYGRGDYDRTIVYLKKLGSLITIGLAYEAQRVDSLPSEAHDEPLDYIVTEKGLYKAL